MLVIVALYHSMGIPILLFTSSVLAALNFNLDCAVELYIMYLTHLWLPQLQYNTCSRSQDTCGLIGYDVEKSNRFSLPYMVHIARSTDEGNNIIVVIIGWWKSIRHCSSN